ncbi:hypothetical protein ACLB2K_004526 [Fragaria x ananassa]
MRKQSFGERLGRVRYDCCRTILVPVVACRVVVNSYPGGRIAIQIIPNRPGCPSRGVLQAYQRSSSRDPLSPFLFLFVNDVLSQILCKLSMVNILQPVQIGNLGPKHRCGSIFNHFSPDPVLVSKLASQQADEFLSVQNRHHRKNSHSVLVPFASGNWIPPSVGTLKINTNATWSSESFGCGLAALLRDSTGSLLHGVVSVGQAISAEAAEAQALLQGLKLAKSVGLISFSMEADYFSLISALKSPKGSVSWELRGADFSQKPIRALTYFSLSLSPSSLGLAFVTGVLHSTPPSLTTPARETTTNLILSYFSSKPSP